MQSGYSVLISARDFLGCIRPYIRVFSQGLADDAPESLEKLISAELA